MRRVLIVLVFVLVALSGPTGAVAAPFSTGGASVRSPGDRIVVAFGKRW